MSDLKLPSVIPIQQIVSEVLNDLNDMTPQNYLRYLQWAIRAFEYVHVSFLKTYDVAYLDLNEVKSAELPVDYIEWQRVGIVDGDELYEIGSNEEAKIPRDESCGELDVATPQYRTMKTAQHYGAPGGIDVTDFKIDKERGVIRLSANVNATRLYLEYVSCGISASGTTYIPRIAKEAIIKFVHWQRSLFDPGSTQWDKKNSEILFYNEARRLHRLNNQYSAKEILNAIRSGYSQTPKR